MATFEVADDSDEVHELAITHVDTVCVVAVSCELDMMTTPALGQLLGQELGNGHTTVLVDLTGCEFMGSSGLAVLVAAREQAASTRTRLALAGLNRTVARSFEATALTSMFDIYPDRATAMGALSP